jgi:hypothetical protein
MRYRSVVKPMRDRGRVRPRTGLEHVHVLDDESNLRISVATHRSIVQVGRSADDSTVVDDHELGMDVA